MYMQHGAMHRGEPRLRRGLFDLPAIRLHGLVVSRNQSGCRSRLSSESKAYSDLVGVASSQCADRKLVMPGDPSASYLIDKLNGTNLCSGSRMPKGMALSSTE